MSYAEKLAVRDNALGPGVQPQVRDALAQLFAYHPLTTTTT